MSTASSSTQERPQSIWSAKCHPLEPKVKAKVEAFFLNNWKFRNEEEKAKFRCQSLASWHCWAYPDSKDDRIEVGAHFTCLLFLIGDELNNTSLAEGGRLIEKIISIVMGKSMPRADVPVEWMVKNIWDEMRVIDRTLADDMLVPAISFWRSQAAPGCPDTKDLGSYFACNKVGNDSELLCAIQRFSTNVTVPIEELAETYELHKNYHHYITIIGDLYSYEMAVLSAKDFHGDILGRSSVQVLAHEIGMPQDCAKRVLWNMCREWERVHERIVEKRREGASEAFLRYMEGIKLQISGTEKWFFQFRLAQGAA